MAVKSNSDKEQDPTFTVCIDSSLIVDLASYLQEKKLALTDKQALQARIEFLEIISSSDVRVACTLEGLATAKEKLEERSYVDIEKLVSIETTPGSLVEVAQQYSGPVAVVTMEENISDQDDVTCWPIFREPNQFAGWYKNIDWNFLPDLEIERHEVDRYSVRSFSGLLNELPIEDMKKFVTALHPEDRQLAATAYANEKLPRQQEKGGTFSSTGLTPKVDWADGKLRSMQSAMAHGDKPQLKSL